MNTLAPFGLRPAYHPTGIVRGIAYSIAAAYNTAIYQNSPVIMNTNGTLTIGTAAADLWGVFQGVQWTDAQQKPQYSNFWPGAQTGATEIIAYALTDALQVYEIQADGAVAATAIGDQADLSNPGTGSTVTGISTATISATLAGAGNQGQLRILGLAPYPDNSWADTYPVLQVQIARMQTVSNKVAV